MESLKKFYRDHETVSRVNRKKIMESHERFFEDAMEEKLNVFELLDRIGYIFSGKDPFLDAIINVFLVRLGLRQATLVQFSSWKKILSKRKAVLGLHKDFLDRLLRLFDLHMHVESKNLDRRLITREEKKPDVSTDRKIGKILGFYCYDHDDHRNSDVPRVGAHVRCKVFGSDINIVSEVCIAEMVNKKKLEEYYKKMVTKWNKVFRQYYDEDVFDFEITNILTDGFLQNNFLDKKIVEKYDDEYYSYLVNSVGSHKEMDAVMNSREDFQFFMHLSIFAKRQIKELYMKNNPFELGEKMDILCKKILKARTLTDKFKAWDDFYMSHR